VIWAPVSGSTSINQTGVSELNDLSKSGLDRSSFLKLGLSGFGVASLAACGAGGGGGILLPRGTSTGSSSFTFHDFAAARSQLGMSTTIGSDGAIVLKNRLGTSLLSGSVTDGSIKLNGASVFTPPPVQQGRADAWFDAGGAVSKVRFNSARRGVEAIGSSQRIGNTVNYQGRDGSVLMGNTSLGGVIFDAAMLSKLAQETATKFGLSNASRVADTTFRDRVAAMNIKKPSDLGRLVQDQPQIIGRIVVYFGLNQQAMNYGGNGGTEVYDYSPGGGSSAVNGVAVAQCVFDAVVALASSFGIPSIIKTATGESYALGEELLSAIVGASAADAAVTTAGVALLTLFGEIAGFAMLLALVAGLVAALVSCRAAFGL